MRSRSSKRAGVAAISDILGKTLDNLGLMSAAKKYQVFSIWTKVVGDISRHAKPRRLSGDVLFVATASSAWSQELTFMRRSIMDKLNQSLGAEYVREIRFSEHLWDPSEDGPPGGVNPFPIMTKGEDAMPTDSIADAALAGTARRFSSTMQRRRQFLLRQGYVLCRVCGCLYPSRKPECPYCKVKKEFLARERAIAILDKAPYLPDIEILGLIGSNDAALVRRARQDLESRCLYLARSVAGREGKLFFGDAESAQAVEKLAALRAGKPVEEMSKEEMEKAVGRRLALAVKKGKRWRHGLMSGPKT